MSFEEVMEVVVHGFEVAGVAILVLGSVAAFAGYVLAFARGPASGAYERVRQAVGRAILLGLEVLIIADIVLTITVDSHGGERADARDRRPRAHIPELLARDRA